MSNNSLAGRTIYCILLSTVIAFYVPHLDVGWFKDTLQNILIVLCTSAVCRQIHESGKNR